MVCAAAYHVSVVVPLYDTTDATTACPVCGALGPRRDVGAVQRAPRIALLACNRCGASSAARLPVPEVLDRYYAAYYGGNPGVTHAGTERFARHVLRVSRCAPRSVLDFGGGSGALGVEIARRTGSACEIVCCDPAGSGTDEVRYVSSLEEVDGPFDLVIASAVLEHLPSPGEVLRALVARTARDGVLYARTPCIALLLRLIPGFDFSYPGHLHDLGPRFWARAIKVLGLPAELVHSGPSPVETSIRTHPVRTLAAHALKLPSRAEVAVGATPRWPLAGGWEAVLRRS